jgi:hypothetical protein
MGKYVPRTSTEDIGNMERVREKLGENQSGDAKH